MVRKQLAVFTDGKIPTLEPQVAYPPPKVYEETERLPRERHVADTAKAGLYPYALPLRRNAVM